MFVEQYRAKNKFQIVGKSQAETLNVLENSILNKKAPKVILLVGDSGIGKTTIANIYGRLFACDFPGKVGSETNWFLNPCGECNGCVYYSTNSRIVNCSSDNGIETTRDIISKLNYTGFGAGKKVYLLDEVQGLTKAAQNSYLTPFENLPPFACFILTTTDEKSIIAPLKSRCMVFRLNCPSHSEQARLVKSIANIQGKKDIISDENISALIDSSGSNVRMLVQNLEILLSSEGRATELITGYSEGEESGDLFKSIIYGSSDGIANWIKMSESIEDYNKFIVSLVSYATKLVHGKHQIRALVIIDIFGTGLGNNMPPKISFIKKLIEFYRYVEDLKWR